jgi:hypothetical protein
MSSDMSSLTPPFKRQRTEARVLPAHTRLYSHALQSIFNFLSFEELHAAALSCRMWQNIIFTMPALTASKEISWNGDLSAICSSRMARHVRSLDWALSSAELLLVSRAMPFLQEMLLDLSSSTAEIRQLEMLHLPHTLREIQCEFDFEASAEIINAFMRACSHPKMLETLQIRLDGVFIDNENEAAIPSDITFAPLNAGLQRLKCLKIVVRMKKWKFTDSQLQQIRNLPVSELDCSCDSACINKLLQMEGPPIRWSSLPENFKINDANVGLIRKLPFLEDIRRANLDFARLGNLDFLALLPNLQSLNFYSLEARLHHLLRLMSAPLPQLRQLSIRTTLSAVELQRILTFMPQLADLHVTCKFSSLEWLEPVKNSLTELNFLDCCHAEFTAEKLLFLQHLPKLASLGIQRSLSENLDTLSIHSLTPPSLFLPSLESFHYYQ